MQICIQQNEAGQAQVMMDGVVNVEDAIALLVTTAEFLKQQAKPSRLIVPPPVVPPDILGPLGESK